MTHSHTLRQVRTALIASASGALLAVCPLRADDTPIPQLSAWETNMTTYGRQICNKLAPGAQDWAVQADAVYYDGERVYYQIADYTGDPTWKYCAGLAEGLYRDGYVIPNNGGAAGWNIFGRGLLMDYQKTGDTTSKNALVLLSQHASFAADGTPLAWTADSMYSREVAYAIMVYLNAEQGGELRRARLADMVNQALGHVDQWFVTKTAPYVRPFMVGITMQALIQAYEATNDSRIPTAIQMSLDGIYPSMWLTDCQCFKYTNISTASGGMDPAPDLNLLIAPAYAWLYYHTGDTKYRDIGDKIFAGGVHNAQNWLYLGKQFDQNYWWSPQYVVWRKAAQPSVAGTTPAPTPVVPPPAPVPTPVPQPTLPSSQTISNPPASTAPSTPADGSSNKILGKLKHLMDKVKK